MQNNKVDMDKICKGCMEYERYIEDSTQYGECEGYARKHVNCPCQNCLIKMMCDNVCDKYKDEWEVFYNAGYH